MNLNFSIDTNIIVGVINHRDRLHEISVNLMKNKRNEKLFICQTALKESQTVFRNKINEIMVEIIQFLPNFFKTPKLSLLDSQTLLIEIFKQLKIKKPESTNFLNLVYDEISTFLRKEQDTKKIPSFLSKLSLEYSNLVITKLENIHSVDELINLNLGNLSSVKRLTKDIYFKNNNDERIFQELMTNLSEILPIEFFSDDEEFVKKSEQGYAKIANDLRYNKNAFSCKLLQDYLVS